MCWLLLAALLFLPVDGMYWDQMQFNVTTVELKESGKDWRQLERQMEDIQFLSNRIEADESMPLIHMVRVMACCLATAQFIFLIHLAMRVFIPNFAKESSSNEDNLLLLVDLPKAFKRKKEFADEDQTANAVVKNESKKQSKLVSSTIFGADKFQLARRNKISKKEKLFDVEAPSARSTEDIKTCIDDSERGTHVRRQPTNVPLISRNERVQSQRLPRAKKGHNKEILDRQEELLDDDDDDQPNGEGGKESVAKPATAEGIPPIRKSLMLSLKRLDRVAKLNGE